MGYHRSRRLLRLLLLRLPHDEVQRKHNHTQWLEPESVQQYVQRSTLEEIRMHTCSATPNQLGQFPSVQLAELFLGLSILGVCVCVLCIKNMTPRRESLD